MTPRVRRLSAALLLATLVPLGSAVSPPPRVIPPRVTPLPPDPARTGSIMVSPLQAKERPTILRSVVIRAEVIGGFASTEVELRFFNPNARTLEGTLEFPLQAGQSVTGLALNFGNNWRSAVPVAKVLGQQVFEDVARRKVDPALIEQTQGNNYRLRVYPVPGRGERRVRLQISEKLAVRAGNQMYRLPLTYPNLRDLKISLTVHAKQSAASAGQPRLEGFKALGQVALSRLGQNTQGVTIRRANLDAVGDLLLTLPAGAVPHTLTQRFAGKDYFLTQISKPATQQSEQKSAPRRVERIDLLWDSSLSGLKRNIRREYALLSAYFRQFPEVEVRLQRFSNVPDRATSFTVRQGDWKALRAELDRTVYDGGTNFAALECTLLACPAGSDSAASERLLFTDGLDNMTLAWVGPSSKPLYVVSSAPQSDPARLAALSRGTGGTVIDLATTGVSEAARLLTGPALNLSNLSMSGARRLVVQEDQDFWYVAGIYEAGPYQAGTAGAARLEYSLLGQRGLPEQRQSLALNFKETSTLIAPLWAAWSLQELQGEPDLNQGEIRRLGEAFNLVTPQTSLIVLDTPQDYLKYEIAPPPDLKAEYDRLFVQQNARLQGEKQNHLEQVRTMLARYEAWWNTDFPKGKRPPPPKPAENQGDSVAGTVAQTEPAAAPVAQNAPASRADQAASASKLAGSPGSGAATTISIQLKKWTSDAPYIARMQKARKQDLYRIYLDERPSYLQSTAFFLDVADFLLDQKETALGLRVLSNLAELNLKNRAVLRILAQRYLQAGRADLAIPVFEQVQQLAPNEPQSGRDLGLAYLQAGRKQQALETLYRVVERKWDGRFPEIELMVLNEINALLATSGGTLNTEFMDRSLIKRLPTDLRVILTWDADNTDMDLWITDPNGERVDYSHNLSFQGGRISRDFTGGYGPEEFSLKLAKPGTYRIEANYYGNTQQLLAGAVTLQARLISHFGDARQTEKVITLRLKDAKDTVLVGEFEVK